MGGDLAVVGTDKSPIERIEIVKRMASHFPTKHKIWVVFLIDNRYVVAYQDFRVIIPLRIVSIGLGASHPIDEG